MSMRLSFFMTTVFLSVFFAFTVSAELVVDIKKDLTPLSAIVLLDLGEEVLVDLTAEKGGRIGDLLTVGSVGSLDKATDVLQVIQLRPGYAIAKRISGKPLQSGVVIRRFDRVAAPLATQPSTESPSSITVDSKPSAAVSDTAPVAKWLGAGVKGLPVGVAVADFDADGQLEIARAFEERLEVGRLVAGDYVQLFTTSLPRETTAIALTAIDLNKNGRTELFLTLVKENEVRSEVFEYTEGQYVRISQNQPWFLTSVVLPGKGAVLLGQKRDRSHYGFSPEIFYMQWNGKQLSPAAAFTLPEKGTIYSLAAASVAGSDRFVRINADGRIELFSNKDGALWVSDETGFSETGFLQPDNQNPHWDADFLHKVFLPTPLIAGPEGSVITAMNSGQTLSDKHRQMKSLTLTRWQWRNQEFKSIWQMSEMDGYVPAMTVADADNDGQDELVVLIAHPNNSFFGTRKSVVKLFGL